jgi:hypothetical protein
VVGGPAIDVFPDPADGGRPPYEQIYKPALESGLFEGKAMAASEFARGRGPPGRAVAEGSVGEETRR